MKAVVVDNKPVFGLHIDTISRICAENGVTFEALNCVDEKDVIAQCQDADAILDVYTKLSAETIQALPNCKAFLRFGIGYDTFDVEAATAAGKMVCNVPDYCIEEVATHTVALILDLSHKVKFLADSVESGIWNANVGYPPHRLSGQTVGFIGFGNIARKAAEYMKAFGVEILAYDPYLTEEFVAGQGAKKVELDELLALSDIVSLHTPLFDSTYHIINEKSIAKMKDGVLLVNTSRGPLIDQDALVAAVESGKIAGAGLDVVEVEPLTDPESPLLRSGRIVVTPHAAYNSVESFAELMEKIAETACNILNGNLDDKTLRRIVNRKELGL
ncbi:MAG: C-terminal binding protein [Eubacteriales bacterium]|nr:C-terminal binding protein [Eubacteriales bacterium]